MSESGGMKKINITNLTRWAGMTLIFIAIILTLIFFMRGSTAIIGNYPDHETLDSLSCVAEGIDYPTYVYDNSKRKSTKINATFNDNKLTTISLVHILYYDDSRKVTDSEALNHAAVNIDSQNADIFSAHYSKFSDAMSMTMYAELKDITNSTKKYMMLNLISADNLTKESVKWNYETQGFVCNISKINEGAQSE